METEIDDFQTDFADLNEEVEYWKHQAHYYRNVLQEAQEDMVEFKDFSKDLETELQSQLELNEKELKDLRQKNMKLSLECDSMREKLEKNQEDTYKRISELEDELAMASALKAENIKYIRELEQANDNLERAKRAIDQSIDDFQQQLNHAIERNAFLESELDEKEALAVMVQRLRDEARDLGQELAVRQRKDIPAEQNESQSTPKNTPSKPTTLPALTRQPSNPSSASPIVARPNNVSQPPTPTREQNGNVSNGQLPKGAPLTPSARVSALNIVGELLRKVGALESKLSSCRSFVREQPPKGLRTTIGPAETPVARESQKRRIRQ